MRREEKYPETKTFHFFNANPHNRIGCDCVIRALCTAMEQSWEQTVRELTECGIKYGYVLNDKKCFEKYLEQKGWVKYPQPRTSYGDKYTGSDFCLKYLTTNKNVIMNIGGNHTSCVINGKINDIWDCSRKCVGNYWMKY